MGRQLHDQLRLYIAKDTYHLVQEGDATNAQTLVIQRKQNEITVLEGSQPPNGGYEKAFEVYGLLGVIPLYNCEYAVFITGRKKVARIFETDIYQAVDFAVYPVEPTPGGTAAWLLEGNASEKQLLKLLKLHLYSGPYYFSYGDYDITTRLQHQVTYDKATPLWQRADDRFFYNKHLQNRLLEMATSGKAKLDRFILPIMQGFFEVRNVNVNGHDFAYGLISRRSRYRCGTRYFRRGIDRAGNVANFNETESLVLMNGGRTQYSYIQTRGSVPLFWSEISNLRYKPDLQVRDVAETADACTIHFDGQIKAYGEQYLINLVNRSGYEAPVKEAYEKVVEKMANPSVHYIYFDFHHECSGLRFGRVSILLDRLEQDLHQQGFFLVDTNKGVQKRQSSVCRTNCMDCLDRTNVVQSQLAKWTLTQQLRQAGIFKDREGIDDHLVFLRIFQNVWADNADIVSKAYSGTGALKTDFTRTGKRTKMGNAQDGWRSAKRYFKNNFSDGDRQDGYDLFLGVWQPKKGDDQVFADHRPLVTRYAPFVLAIGGQLLLMSYFLPSLYQRIFGSNYVLLFLWLATAGTSAAYISSHGVEYVDWPKLSPEHYEAFAYRGPGHESGRRGRSGQHVPAVGHVAKAAKADGEKKRLD